MPFGDTIADETQTALLRANSTRPPRREQSGGGGGVLGSLFGGIVGSVVPGLGTALGAGIGGLLGDAVDGGGFDPLGHIARAIPGLKGVSLPETVILPGELDAAFDNAQRIDDNPFLSRNPGGLIG